MEFRESILINGLKSHFKEMNIDLKEEFIKNDLMHGGNDIRQLLSGTNYDKQLDSKEFYMEMNALNNVYGRELKYQHNYPINTRIVTQEDFNHFKGIKNLNLENCFFQNVQIDGKLENANFQGSSFHKCDIKADISKSDFSSCRFTWCDIEKSKIKNNDFKNAAFIKNVIDESEVNNCNFTKVKIENSTLKDSFIENSSLWGTEIKNLILQNTKVAEGQKGIDTITYVKENSLPFEVKETVKVKQTEQKKKQAKQKENPLNKGIQRNIRQSGFRPTHSMIANITHLNELTKKNNSLKDIQKKYKQKDFGSPEEAKIIKSVARECKYQEHMKVEVLTR